MHGIVVTNLLPEWNILMHMQARYGFEWRQERENSEYYNRQNVVVPQIHTIRVLAIFGVFFHHLWKGIVLHPDSRLQDALEFIFDSGSDGVILFNIISGFLLALPHISPQHPPFPRYGQFLPKRLMRIIPPYYIALVILSLGNIAILGFPVRPALRILALHLTFLNSFVPEMMSTNFSHFWYMGMLIQFYLAFPIIMRLYTCIGPVRSFLLILIICWGSWCLLAWHLSINVNSPLGAAQHIMHFNLPGRLPEFAFGMWLAFAWNQSTRSLTGHITDKSLQGFLIPLALYGILGFYFVNTMMLPLLHMYHVALSILFFMAVFLCNPAAMLGRAFITRSLSGLSYALYILHQPFLSYVGVIPGKIPGTVIHFLGYSILLLPICFLSAGALNGLTTALMERFQLAFYPVLSRRKVTNQIQSKTDS